MIKKVWGDSVWSKVIANGISYVLGSILVFIGFWIKSKYDNVSVWQNLNTAYEYPIKLGWILIGFASLLFLKLIYILSKNIFKKTSLPKLSETEINQNQLRQFTKYIDDKLSIIFRWRVWFDKNTPYATDIIYYCNRHSTPLKFGRNGCIDNDCENNDLVMNKNTTKLAIESMLQHEYDLLTEKSK